MKKNSNIHIIYKKMGETPNEAILRYKKENPEYDHLAMTYAGRLDPMAEGLLLVLSGEERFEKEKYLDLPKTYRFEVLWGFETDSLDLLGRVVEGRKLKVKSGIPEIPKIKKELNKSLGKFEQLYPIYSSRPVGGKSLFEWAREGRVKEIDIPKHEVEIFDVKLVKRREVQPKKLLNEILERIDLVKGDFRQEEIKKSWQEALKNLSKTVFDTTVANGKNVSKTVFDTLTIDSMEIEVSSGFYVRQFVTDLARGLGTSALAYSIKRTKVGDMSLANIKSKG